MTKTNTTSHPANRSMLRFWQGKLIARTLAGLHHSFSPLSELFQQLRNLHQLWNPVAIPVLIIPLAVRE